MKHKGFFILLVLFLVFSVSPNVLAASEGTTKLPSIYGKSAITVDVSTGEIIYAKNVDKQMYPASTTKLLTALLLAENMKKTDKLKYTQNAKAQPADSLNVNFHPIGVDETMSGRDVMDGMLLYSANDLAYMIADNVSGNSLNFIDLMNDKVAKLRMTGTHFVTPNGLHNAEHYTTPYDMSILARAAFESPWVKEAMSKTQSTISTSKGTTFKLKNTNKLLGVDGCIAGKTGYTSLAGRCLVAFYERNGRQIMGVVLGAVNNPANTNVYSDMEKIINYSYNSQQTVLHANNAVIKTTTLNYEPLGLFGPKKTVTVPLVVKEDVSYYNNEANIKTLQENINLTSTSVSTLKENKSIGNLIVTEKGKIKTYKLYSMVSKEILFKYNIYIYLMAAGRFILFLIVLAFIVRTININKRKRRRRRRRRISH